MVRCRNCGQKTEGDYCQWCGYPIVRYGFRRRRKLEKEAVKEAEARREAKEAKERARREAEEAKRAKEAEAKATREAEEARREVLEALEAKGSKERTRIAREEWEKARREGEAEEARKEEEAKEKTRKAREEWEEARKKALEAREAKESEERAAQDIGSDIYEGNVQLVVQSPLGFGQLRQFEEYLERVENLSITSWVGGAMEGGTEITVIIGLSVEKPMTLLRILKEMPTVEKVDKKGDKIVVTLKTPIVT